ERAIGLSYVLLWFLYRIQITGGYSCLYMHRFKRGELKTIVTALILYEEGFVQILGHIVTKPEFLWTQADRDLITPTDYSLCIGFSLQIGTLLLLQCFWKYLAKLVARATFMTSKEFKFYIIMTKCILELMLISMLGGVSHFRFRKLLSNSQYRNDAQFITHKMKYFQDLNLLLSVALFIFSLCFIILSADGLTAKKTINMHKFAADFLICNINITCIIVWVIVILIFHPKKTVEEHTRIPDTSFSSSSSTEQDTKIHQYK
ncbi:uncharacterized protein EV154DRAFT_424274, partial [Mucor mucedo]|uniref:uncharacterized protein n=1 Tax=Mucor mucedo TaxID=29922 RepID=UPI00221EE872